MKGKLLSKAIICSLLAINAGSLGSVSYAENEIYVETGDTQNIADKIITAVDGNQGDGEGISAIEVQGGTLAATNVTVNDGAVHVEDNGTLNFKDGTINAGTYYVNNKPISGYTFKALGGKANVENSNINISVEAGEPDASASTMTFINSNINASDNYGHGHVMAADNGKIILNGSQNNTYQAKEFFGTVGNGQIEINGGTLIADNLRNLVNGSLLQVNSSTSGSGMTQDVVSYIKNNVSKNIILKENGVIQTKTGQIFANGIDTSSRDAVLKSKDSGNVTNDYIKYQGGTLKFTDKEYTQAYLDSAKQHMLDYGGTTAIVMTGDLVDENGLVKNYISVDEAVKNGSNVYTTQIVQTENDITTLDVNGGRGVADQTQSADSFNAARLKVSDTTTDIIVRSDKRLGLGSNESGDFIYGNSKPLNVTVYGSLNLGTVGLTEQNTEETLSSNVTVNDGTLHSVAGINTISGDVQLQNKGSIKVTNGSSLTINGGLTGNESAKIMIGNEESAGTLISGNTQLAGTSVVFDPIWKNGQTIKQGSKGALNFKNDAVDGKLIVGENSTLSLGRTDTNVAETAFKQTGLTWGKEGILSAVYVDHAQDISNGALLVDKGAKGDETLENGDVRFADGSLLMVNGDSIRQDDSYAISGAQSVTVSDSKLYIDNADKGTFHIIKANADINGSWKDSDIISNNALLKFKGDTSDAASFIVTGAYDNVSKVYGNSVVISHVVDATLQDEMLDKKDKAYDFFTAAANTKVNPTKAAQVDAFNSMANLGALGGVNYGTYQMSNAMTDAVSEHLSLANHGEQDKDIWVRYVHNSSDIDDVDLGGLQGDYDASFNSFTVGSDLYHKGSTTIGAAFSYSDGDITGNSRYTSTNNDAKYYGFSIYGRVHKKNYALLADISYLSSDNDLTQYNSGKRITANADADALSVGIKAETAIGDFVPYIGARYMRIGVDGYTNSLGVKYDTDDQNLWLLPVGVRYSKQIKGNVWTIKPFAELGYIWTTGDRDTRQIVSYNGGYDNFIFDTTDDGSFIGRIGVQAENDTWEYGIGYGYQKGDMVQSNQFTANVTYKF